MRTFRHNTGRHYGAPQVLAITAPTLSPSIDPAELVLVHFDDPARNIVGVVQVLACETGAYDIGPAVLREYDHGRYREVSGERAGIYL